MANFYKNFYKNFNSKFTNYINSEKIIEHSAIIGGVSGAGYGIYHTTNDNQCRKEPSDYAINCSTISVGGTFAGSIFGCFPKHIISGIFIIGTCTGIGMLIEKRKKNKFNRKIKENKIKEFD